MRRGFWFWRHRHCRVAEERGNSGWSSWHCDHHGAYWSDYEMAGHAPGLSAAIGYVGRVALVALLIGVWTWDVFANHWWGL